MAIIFSGIKLKPDFSEKHAYERAMSVCGLKSSQVKNMAVHRLSVDARRGSVEKVYAVRLELFDSELEQRLARDISYVSLHEKQKLTVKKGNQKLQYRPVVIGFGPAGMFCALTLARYGFCPLVLELGADVDSRVEAVERFFTTGQLDLKSNIQFGEGGAGTFSDGKLTTRINDPLCDAVIRSFIKFGAPKDIEFRQKPHVGTDNLRLIVKNIRAEIVRRGGEVRFFSEVTDFDIRNNQLRGVTVNGDTIPTRIAVLAVGHSSRGTFDMLYRRGISLVAKPFSVGARIEHLQSTVDRALYRDYAGHPKLPSAEYAFSARFGSKAVYTFCMCPGGSVVAAASETGGVVTNGMSDYLRDKANANTALVVSVDESDFGSDPFAAIAFQREIERRAFELAGGGYKAPASDVQSFMRGASGLTLKQVAPTYPLGVVACDLEKVLGRPICEAMRFGVTEFEKKLYGFSDDAVLTAPETRTSSPVRILRNDNRQAVGVAGLYPCGEGAGYAGGIMSAAVDGMKTAIEIIEKHYYL